MKITKETESMFLAIIVFFLAFGSFIFNVSSIRYILFLVSTSLVLYHIDLIRLRIELKKMYSRSEEE